MQIIFSKAYINFSVEYNLISERITINIEYQCVVNDTILYILYNYVTIHVLYNGICKFPIVLYDTIYIYELILYIITILYHIIQWGQYDDLATWEVQYSPCQRL